MNQHPNTQQPTEQAPRQETPQAPRKPFTRPALERHEELPAVTGVSF